MESGEVILYTSDGDPDTISVPDPLPPLLEGELDPGLIAASNKTLIQYDPNASLDGANGLSLREALLSRPRDEVLKTRAPRLSAELRKRDRLSAGLHDAHGLQLSASRKL
jgi:hypothetical protein